MKLNESFYFYDYSSKLFESSILTITLQYTSDILNQLADHSFTLFNPLLPPFFSDLKSFAPPANIPAEATLFFENKLYMR
jgi:hypothetical protein